MVLQTLLAEQVSIRDMRTISEALSARANKSMDTNSMVSIARVALARQIVQGIVGQEGNLPVVTLDPNLEQILLQTQQQAQKSGGDNAFIEPQLAEKLNNALVKTAKQLEVANKPQVLLVAAPIRSMLYQFIRFNVPDMKVLAYNEVPDNKQITIETSIGSDFVPGAAGAGR